MGNINLSINIYMPYYLRNINLLFTLIMKLYNLTTCEELIQTYINKYEGELYQIYEGTLGLGKLILYNGNKRKSIIIEEVFLNHWSSAHKIRMYNELPKKYKTLITKQTTI